MFEVATAGRSPAARPGARGVPDLRQMPEHDPGIVAVCLMPVVAAVGGDRLDLEEQVPLPGHPGGEPPGPVSSGRAGLISWSEGERWPAGRVGSIWCAVFVPFDRPGGGGPGAAVADGVPLAVGHRQTPGRPGAAGGSTSQVAGEVGVARGGTRDEIRSFRKRARAAHDCSAGISGKVQRGRKRCCIAWSDAQPTSGSAE